MLLFAYGSNMDAAQLSKRLGRQLEYHFVGSVKGYKFGYFGHSQNWQGYGSADMIKMSDDGSRVWGVVYDVAEKDLDILDEFEHVSSGRYKQVSVKVESEVGKTANATTYILKRTELEERPNKPLDAYREKCIDSALKVGLPPVYIDQSLRA